MTTGHRHRHVRINPSTRVGGAVRAFLTKPRIYCDDLERVDASPYPYGLSRDHVKETYYLSLLGIFHRWTGLTLVVPDRKVDP